MSRPFPAILESQIHPNSTLRHFEQDLVLPVDFTGVFHSVKVTQTLKLSDNTADSNAMSTSNSQKRQRERFLEDLDVDSRIILKWILDKLGVKGK